MNDPTTALWTLDSLTLDGHQQPRLDIPHLDITPGRTAVMGASGAGKTSLLNLLVGFETPDHGQLINRIPRNPDRLPLFWIPPDWGLWPQATAREHLLAVLPGDSPQQQDTIDVQLEVFGLSERAAARPGELSAGQRSRLAVARGLVANAAVLVADEPLVHVDPARLEHDWETLVQHSSQQDTSLVFSTHSPEPVLRHADRVVVLAHGKVVAHGDVDTLYLHPPSREVANSLGPANWFEAPEAREWQVGSGTANVCLRPEQIVLVADNEATARVLESRAIGSIRETQLELLDSGTQRNLIHLAQPGTPTPSGNVRIAIAAD